MAFLFQSPTPRHLSLSVHPDALEELPLNDQIWRSLEHFDAGRVAISVTPSSPVHGRNPSTLKSLTCWTTPSPDLPGLGIPSQWLESYPELFGDASRYNRPTTHLSHTIISVRPVPLSEIVLAAESKTSHEISHEDLEATFYSRSTIFRQGSVIVLSAHPTPPQLNGRDTSGATPQAADHTCRFRVVMTEPTLQGYARPDFTRFILVPRVEHPHAPDHPPNGSVQGSDAESESGSDSDAEALEIDETFLASSVLGAPARASGPSDNAADGLNGSFSSGHEYPISASPSFTYKAEALDAPLPPCPEQSYDPECAVFLRTAELSRIGIFNGDWGIVGDATRAEARLARIFGRDNCAMTAGTGPRALGSPVLLSNVLAGPSYGVQDLISVRSSLFGSRTPPVPTASAVTVARVASPYSSDRAYQPFFLHALKEYFDGQKRLVKKGDLVAVSVRGELARLVSEREAEDARGKEEAGAPDEMDDLLSYDLPLAKKSASGAVFFKITNLEYDVVDTIQNGSPPDHYIAATMGELGCWIDPQVTKMVQAGLEHTRVPDVASYLNIVTGMAPLPPCESPLLGLDRPFAKIRDLAEAALYPSAAEYGLQLTVLLKGSRGVGKFTAVSWVARSLGMHLLEINSFDLVGDTDAQTEGTLRARFERAAACAPCLFVLRHIDALARTTQVLETGKEPAIAGALQDCISDLARSWTLTGHPVLVVGTSSEPERVPAGVLACFKHEIAFEAPAEPERFDILTRLLRDVPCAPDVSLRDIAVQTAAMVAADLVDLVGIAQSVSLKRAMHAVSDQRITERDLAEAGMMLTGSDLDTALLKARSSYSESIGAPRIPSVQWDDVGGLAAVKADILDTIQLPLEHPELFADGLKKRSGILLYGPPGTGKTLLAKAVATSCALNFFSVKGPELLNMYIGESEANVRRVFQRARDARPCVIFFDELDSVAPKRGSHGDAGGVMDRIVSQLLAELDGMADGTGGADVFVIGATNRPDLLDPALLRPGRFDRMLYLGVSDSHAAQCNILRALTRKFRLDPGLDLTRVAAQCPLNYTGADLYALCADAMLKAMARKAEHVEAQIAELNRGPPPRGHAHPHPLTPQYYLAELATRDEVDVWVAQRDFESALRELVPSVSEQEMAHYAVVQRRFASGAMDSDRGRAAEHSSSYVDAELKAAKGKERAVE